MGNYSLVKEYLKYLEESDEIRSAFLLWICSLTLPNILYSIRFSTKGKFCLVKVNPAHIKENIGQKDFINPVYKNNNYLQIKDALNTDTNFNVFSNRHWIFHGLNPINIIIGAIHIHNGIESSSEESDTETVEIYKNDDDDTEVLEDSSKLNVAKKLLDKKPDVTCESEILSCQTLIPMLQQSPKNDESKAFFKYDSLEYPPISVHTSPTRCIETQICDRKIMGHPPLIIESVQSTEVAALTVGKSESSATDSSKSPSIAEEEILHNICESEFSIELSHASISNLHPIEQSVEPQSLTLSSLEQDTATHPELSDDVIKDMDKMDKHTKFTPSKTDQNKFYYKDENDSITVYRRVPDDEYLETGKCYNKGKMPASSVHSYRKRSSKSTRAETDSNEKIDRETAIKRKVIDNADQKRNITELGGDEVEKSQTSSEQSISLTHSRKQLPPNSSTESLSLRKNKKRRSTLRSSTRIEREDTSDEDVKEAEPIPEEKQSPASSEQSISFTPSSNEETCANTESPSSDENAEELPNLSGSSLREACLPYLDDPITERLKETMAKFYVEGFALSTRDIPSNSSENSSSSEYSEKW